MDCQRDTEACSPLQTQLFSLQGHTALVTGAGSGLGKYMAHALLHAGANLILVGRTLDRLEASADEIFLSLKQQGGHLAYDSDPAARSAHRDPDQNKRIACIAFDVSELKTLPELAQKASQPFGAPGHPRQCRRAESAQAVERTHARDLGIHAAAQSFRAVLPRSGPRARNDAARMGAHHQHRLPSKQPGLPQRPALRSVKGRNSPTHAGHGRSMVAARNGHHGQCPSRPGFFKTQLTAPLFDKPEVVEALARQTTMNRVGFAEDIQGLTMFLASPASGYITGQVIHIDGGWTAI